MHIYSWRVYQCEIILCFYTLFTLRFQIATVLRNLSFDGPNAQAMSESELMLRFALLCSHSEMPQLKHTGLDLLCNIATKVHVFQRVGGRALGSRFNL